MVCTCMYISISLYLYFQDKTSALTTYAICGFSSFGTLAMFVGVWSTVDPNRVKQVGAMLPRVYMNTNLACFLTACVAGTSTNSVRVST